MTIKYYPVDMCELCLAVEGKFIYNLDGTHVLIWKRITVLKPCRHWVVSGVMSRLGILHVGKETSFCKVPVDFCAHSHTSARTLPHMPHARISMGEWQKPYNLQVGYTLAVRWWLESRSLGLSHGWKREALVSYECCWTSESPMLTILANFDCRLYWSLAVMLALSSLIGLFWYHLERGKSGTVPACGALNSDSGETQRLLAGKDKWLEEN